MLKAIAAIVAAAVSAGFIVSGVPEVAAGTSSTAQSSQAIIGAANDNRTGDRACLQSWPYYEQSCLRDARRSDGKARVVRVISIDRSTDGRNLQVQR